MSRFAKELEPLENGYIYTPHEVRSGLTFSPEQQPYLEALYRQHFEGLPYQTEMAAIDAELKPGNRPDFFLGETTAQITFMMEMIDPITAGHSRSVAEAGVETAREAGITDVPESHIFYGLYLHDVYKIAQPELLLQPDFFMLHEQGLLLYDWYNDKKIWTPRPGEHIMMMNTNTIFTAEQKARMRRHAPDGAKYLRNIGYPETVALFPEQHHAYFGFMNAEPHPLLKPSDKTDVGRLSNIVDFGVTSRSRRVYKPENSCEHTLRYLRQMELEGAIPGYLVDAYERASERTGESWLRHTIHLPNAGGGAGLRAVFGD